MNTSELFQLFDIVQVDAKLLSLQPYASNAEDYPAWYVIESIERDSLKLSHYSEDHSSRMWCDANLCWLIAENHYTDAMRNHQETIIKWFIRTHLFPMLRMMGLVKIQKILDQGFRDELMEIIENALNPPPDTIPPINDRIKWNPADALDTRVTNPLWESWKPKLD